MPDMQFIEQFSVRYGYLAEYLAACLIFACNFPRRERFWLRFAGCLAFFVGLSEFWYYISTNFPVVWLGFKIIPLIQYVLYFVLAVPFIYLCFDRPLPVALFAGVAAISTQHGAYKAGELVQRLVTTVAPAYVGDILYMCIIVPIYVAVYFLFRKGFRGLAKEYLASQQVVFLAVLLMLYTNVFQYSNEMAVQPYIIYALYDILCCLFTLYIQYSNIKSGRREHEYKLMQHLQHLGEQQYNTAKSNMEMLDIKMHDIKHFLLGMKNVLTEEQIAEIEKMASVYDSTVKSGNKVLDVIFTEKSLTCEQQGIGFEKIVDGSLLNFMTASDIYALFVNAIDNAIEAVSRVEDKNKRIISFMVRQSRGMVFIAEENCFSGELHFEDELPVTTKPNKMYHGFGMKSIRNVVEKYGGTLVIKAEGGIFRLNILLPMGKTANGGKSGDR